MNRIVTAHTPLGEALRFRAMQGTEALSQLFEFDVELLSDSCALDLKALLGKSLSLEMEVANAGKRFLDGIVARCVLLGREGGTDRQYLYRATVRPWLWLLTRSQDCKIFQNQSVPQILQTVMGEYGFPIEQRLTGSYRQWGYCVQYQETDFAFVSRLMEHEGIYYFFKHEQGQHTLVLCDDIGTHEAFPGYDSVPFFASERVGSDPEECVDIYQVAEEIAPGTYVTDDYNFTKPRASLQNQRSNPASHDHANYEIYDWLGGYSDPGEADHYSRIRIEELQAERERDEGHASARGLAPGYRFSLRNCPRQEANREYLVVSVTYRLREAGYASNTDTAHYDFDFVTQPTSLPFRPRRLTPRPHTNGPQTAVVVGPGGEDVWTDQYGRVKVQFRWDRYGQMNENSSCWVRVASNWAGSGYGGMHVPRIGQEVVVDFIAGEPDRPIIVGCTYNADQMPPFMSPTQSGFISRSMKGTPGNANALRFEDEPGAEELWLHAERNQRTTVENEVLVDVGAGYTKNIGTSYTKTVAQDNVYEVGNLNKVESLTAFHRAKQTFTLHGNTGVEARSNQGPMQFFSLNNFDAQSQTGHMNFLSQSHFMAATNSGGFSIKSMVPSSPASPGDVDVHAAQNVHIQADAGHVAVKAGTSVGIAGDSTGVGITAGGGDPLDPGSGIVKITGTTALQVEVGSTTAHFNADGTVNITASNLIKLDAPKVKAKSGTLDWTQTPLKLELTGGKIEIMGFKASATGYVQNFNGGTNNYFITKTDTFLMKKDIGALKSDDAILKDDNNIFRKAAKVLDFKSSVLHLIF